MIRMNRSGNYYCAFSKGISGRARGSNLNMIARFALDFISMALFVVAVSMATILIGG